MPTDSPLTRVLEEFEAEGYAGQFIPQAGGFIRCVPGGHVFSASSTRLDEGRRLEGVSDPADSLLVSAMHCPICRTAGTLVLGYGPDAGQGDIDALSALEFRTR